MGRNHDEAIDAEVAEINRNIRRNNRMPKKTKAAPPSLLEVVKEYAEQIENNPDEGDFRACCMAEFNYSYIGRQGANPHAQDCKAIAAIAAHEAASVTFECAVCYTKEAADGSWAEIVGCALHGRCPCGNTDVVPRNNRLFCDKCRKP